MTEGSSPETNGQPFDGITVVEFGQFVAVPFAAQLLAEGGAHVIKIEAPEGDPTRRLRPIAPHETRTFISRNRGKHSLPLALSRPEAQPVIEALLANADVTLMNFRPGGAEKLGLETDSLKRRFPRLIIGSVTAFGKSGPEARHAGMDIVVQARTGLMAANGRIIDGLPAPGDPVSADYMCAMTLAFGISAALFRRAQTGKGGVVDTSLMQAAMTLANNQLIRSQSLDKPAHDKAIAQLNRLRASGAPYAEQLKVMPSIRALPMLKIYFRTYETADSALAIACGSHSLRVKFIDAVGLVDIALDSMDDRDLAEHYDRLMHSAEEKMRTKSTEQWMQTLQDAGVPVSAVKLPVELFDDEQAEANHFFHTLEHPTAGDIKALSPPLELDQSGFAPAPATAAFGSETQAILTTLGFTQAKIDALIDAGVTHRG